MNDLQLINKNEVPNGGFRYAQAETNFTITAPTWNDLVTRVRKHRIANNLPIGLMFEREIENQLANVLPPNFVEPYQPPVKFPLARELWPEWANVLAKMRNDTDKGVGDTAERVFGAFGGDRLKQWYEKLTGHKCHCKERKEAWNMQYGYAESS